MTLPKNNHGFSLIPIMVFLAIFSVIGFGVSNYLQNSADKDNDVLAAFAQGSTVNCIQNPSAAGCQSVYQKPAVNKSFFQGSNDTKPPWWRPQRGGGNTGGGGNDICDTQPGSQACADWQKFKAYCDDNVAKNPDKSDPNCTNYLISIGKFKQDQNQAFANYCKTEQGRRDGNCKTLICSANPNDEVCKTTQDRPGTTPTPARATPPAPIQNPSPEVRDVQTSFCTSDRATPGICGDNKLTEDELIFICKTSTNPRITTACSKVRLPEKPAQVVNQNSITTKLACPSYTTEQLNSATGVKTCTLKPGYYYAKLNCTGTDKVIAYNTQTYNFVCLKVTPASGPTGTTFETKTGRCPTPYSSFVRYVTPGILSEVVCRLNDPWIVTNSICPRGTVEETKLDGDRRICKKVEVTVGTGEEFTVNGRCPAYSGEVGPVPGTGMTRCRLNSGIIFAENKCPDGYSQRDPEKLNGKFVCQINPNVQSQNSNQRCGLIRGYLLNLINCGNGNMRPAVFNRCVNTDTGSLIGDQEIDSCKITRDAAVSLPYKAPWDRSL